MSSNHRRRILIALATLPCASFAQQGKTWRIGFLSLRSIHLDDAESNYGPFRIGLRELGYAEGKNLVIEKRSADNRVERLRDLAADLVRLKVDLIVAAGTQATAAAQAATSSIPIVMGSTGDPVGSGFVKSLARPGGNITGLSNLAGDIGPKQLQILATIIPKLSAAAVLVNPTNSSHIAILKHIQAAGQVAGIRIVAVEASAPTELDESFAAIRRQRAAAVIVATDAFFNESGQQIAALALKYRIATMFTPRENVFHGGLICYGQNIGDNYRQAALYVDRILRGANPAELPVEQSTRLEMVINRRTAKALGLTIPSELLVRADRVID